MQRIDETAEVLRRAGAEAYRLHGELGEFECPHNHGPPMDARRTWWMEGYLGSRTAGRLGERGVAV